MSDQPCPHGVVDDRRHHRFLLGPEGASGELVYRVSGDRLVLVHTEVPPELRDHGLGGRLVRAAVERAAAEAMTVVPACPFARQWLAAHPDAAATVEIDWSALQA